MWSSFTGPNFTHLIMSIFSLFGVDIYVNQNENVPILSSISIQFWIFILKFWKVTWKYYIFVWLIKNASIPKESATLKICHGLHYKEPYIYFSLDL